MPYDDHPFIAIWETTQACDLVCAYSRLQGEVDIWAGAPSSPQAVEVAP